MSFSLTWEMKGGKCGVGEFTPNLVLQNSGQSLGISERWGKDYFFLGEERGHEGEGRG